MPQHSHHHGHDAFGNPHDFKSYLEKLEGPERDAWQKPDALIRALKLKRGDVVADVGAGPGYFTRRLAKKASHVWALEAEPRMLEILAQRTARLDNVAPVLAPQHDPRLPAASVDLALMVNTYHHLDLSYLRRLAKVLKRGGRLVNVDFHPESELGPKHKVPRDEFLRDAKKAGLHLVAEHTFLSQQYALELTAR